MRLKKEAPVSAALSAEFIPLQIDPVLRRVLFARLDAVQRARASFLDARTIQSSDAQWLPWESLQALRATHWQPADGIFHIGHCGSTLLSRLLGEWPTVQSLREPAALRTVSDLWHTRDTPDSRLSAEATAQALLDLWRHWSTPLGDATRTVVKATSTCNQLIEPLLLAHPMMRVVLLDMSPLAYFATIMKSAGSRLDAATAAAERLLYLRSQGLADGLSLHALDPAEQVAMGWLGEQLRFDRLQQQFGSRVLRLRFDTLLAARGQALSAIAAHFALAPQGVDVALASANWGEYSKSPGHKYDESDRQHDLQLSLRTFAPDIDRATSWLQRYFAQQPGLRATLRVDLTPA